MSVVLITGGAGFIGSVLATRLLQAGGTVCVLDDLDPTGDPVSATETPVRGLAMKATGRRP